MKFHIRYFFNFGFILKVFLFSFTLFLSLGVALKMLSNKISNEPAMIANNYSGWYFLLLFVLATVLIILVLKYFKKTWLIQGLFYIAIIEGILIFSQAYFTYPAYLYILFFIIIAWLIYKNVFIHNVAIVLAISGVSVFFGLSMDPSVAIIILLLLAIYDFWAVYKSKHMVKMFKGLSESKVHFALIIPERFMGLYVKVKDVKVGSDFLFLGTGDLAIPAIFVISSLKISLETAFYTSLGAIFGLILLYTLFVIQEYRKPMPGLPPIILGTLLGYIISFLV